MLEGRLLINGKSAMIIGISEQEIFDLHRGKLTTIGEDCDGDPIFLMRAKNEHDIASKVEKVAQEMGMNLTRRQDDD